MTVFIGADHRGFELKNKVMEYLQDQNIRVEDMGNYSLDPLDDYPIYARKVAQAVMQNPTDFLGIVICGSGIGVSIAANRVHGIRCGLCTTVDQAKHARENDHINVVSLAADMTDFETVKQIVDAFVKTKVKNEEKYLKRTRLLDEN